MISRLLRVAKYVLAFGAVSLVLVIGTAWRTAFQDSLVALQRDDTSPLPPFNLVRAGSQLSINTHSSHALNNTPLHPQPTSFSPQLAHPVLHRNRSYLLALGYTEQLSAATHTMFTLGTLAADWGVSMVEPFIKKSFLFGLEDVVPPDFMAVKDQDALHLFDIYNQTEVNQELHEKISPQVSMNSFDTFLTEASPSVTLFHFTTKSRDFVQRSFALDSKDTKLLENKLADGVTDNVVPCLSLDLPGLRRVAHDIEEKLNVRRRAFQQNHGPDLESSSEFKVNRLWCLDSRKVYRSDTLRKYIPPHSTVIFTNWKGCGIRSCYYGDGENDKPVVWSDKFRYAILTKSHTVQRLDNEHILHHSSIEDNARRYLQKIGYSSPFVSIHVRIERLVKHSKETDNPSAYIKQCLEEFTKAVHNLTHSKGDTKSLLVTDVGSKFGTSTCQKGKNCKLEETTRVLTRLQGLGFHPQSYDPHVTNSTENSGYVSLVEMHMLAGGDKLVMMGYGGFQAILENLFLSRGHTEQDIVHICHSH